MSESKQDKTAKPASSPDDLVKGIDLKLSKEEQEKVKGGLKLEAAVEYKKN